MRRQAIIGAVLLIGVGVVLGATVFRADIAQATGLAQSVTVDNTTANPVPMREQNLDGQNIRVHEEGVASVNVTNTTVPVHEQGTAAVREQGTVTVNVLDAPGQHPFVGSGAVTIADGSYNVTDSFTVPVGKRLVIQSVAGSTGLPIGQVPQLITVQTVSGGNQGRYELNAEKRATYSGRDWWVFSQQATAYADGGSTVLFIVNRFPDNTGNGSVNYYLWGYLINE